MAKLHGKMNLLVGTPEKYTDYVQDVPTDLLTSGLRRYLDELYPNWEMCKCQPDMYDWVTVIFRYPQKSDTVVII